MKEYILTHSKKFKILFYVLLFLLSFFCVNYFAYGYALKIRLACTAVLGAFAAFIAYKYVRLGVVAGALYKLYGNKKIIYSLTANDFKTKYAGSYFGFIWAFIQPVFTIMVFWFVFQMGFKSGDVENVPYILWFATGLIPWFFFSDAWGSATNCFIEYSYLVKKVVFEIDILPIVKILSALLVHIFFIGFMIVMYLIYGIRMDKYTWQLIYYVICLLCLVMVLSYITAPLVIFFKDLVQVMNIILQFGMWLTPIMWNIDTMEIPEKIKIIFKLNPMFYIVSGFRNAMIYKTDISESIGLSIYFWAVIIILMFAAKFIYVKLKPHFADVL